VAVSCGLPNLIDVAPYVAPDEKTASSGGLLNHLSPCFCLAPRAGFEPATNRLTAGCSTTELPGNRPEPRAAAPITKLPCFAKRVERGPPKERVEATAGIEPACTDLQSAA
jgi:hypothetical protein